MIHPDKTSNMALSSPSFGVWLPISRNCRINPSTEATSFDLDACVSYPLFCPIIHRTFERYHWIISYQFLKRLDKTLSVRRIVFSLLMYACVQKLGMK